MIEPEIKLVFVCLFVLMVLADAAKGHAVLPAFILGLVMARHYQQHRQEQERLRVVAFAFLTPVLLPARRPERLARGGVRQPRPARRPVRGEDGAQDRPRSCRSLAAHVPAARDLHHPADEHRPHLRHDLALYGLNAGIIDRTQFSLLVTVVVLSAIVPTAIAQRWFSPDLETERAADANR